MPATSSIHFFSTEKIPIPERVIDDLINLFGPTRDNINVRRASSPDRGWGELQDQIKGKDPQFTDPELTLRGISPKLISSYFTKDESPLWIDLSMAMCSFHTKVYEATMEIPEEIRENFAASQLALTIGWHDVYTSTEHEDGRFFGRAFLSVRFWGWNHPSASYRDIIFENPGIKSAQDQMENLVGPLDRCFYID